MRNRVFTLLVLCVVIFRFDSASMAGMMRFMRVSDAEDLKTKATSLFDMTKEATSIFDLARNKLSTQVDTRRDNLQIGNPELKEMTKDEKLKSSNSPTSKETKLPESDKEKALRSRDNDLEKLEKEFNNPKNSKNSKKKAVKLIQRNSELRIKHAAMKSMKRQGANKSNETDADSENDDLNPYTIKNDMIKMLASIESIKSTVDVIGRTEEYNDIVLCKITDRKVNELNDAQRRSMNKKRSRKRIYEHDDLDSDKKVIFIVHGLSGMGFVNIPCLNQEKQLKKLVQLYTAHLDKFDIFLVPLANPDGISDRTLGYWNKNKSPQEQCSGVALDRNFDVVWNYSGNSCSQYYSGPEPFSEKESRAVLDVLQDHSHRIVAYIHVHAGTYSSDVFKGDAVLYPKGYLDFNVDDDKYIDIKSEVEEALKNAGFRSMSVTVNTLYNWYGNKVFGTSVDFAASEYGIPYAFEFVMQVYEDDPAAKSSDERVSDNVLTEMWRRVIDTVFANVHKSTYSIDEK